MSGTIDALLLSPLSSDSYMEQAAVKAATSTVHTVDASFTAANSYELAEISRQGGAEDIATGGLNDASSRGPEDGLSVQELAPMDSGRQAWTYCASTFVLETFIWGFGFRSVRS